MVSIITVVRNGESCIQYCIDSIKNQSYENIEYIIIDGCSTDNTLNIIRRNSDSISYWISEPDDGIYFAMNKGITVAQGDIIGILNADDLYYPTTIERVVQAFKSHDFHGYTSGPIDLIDANGVTYGISTPLSFEKRYIRRFIEMPCSHQSVFVSKTVYQSCGVFDTHFKLSADYDLILRFMHHNIPCIELHESLGAFRSGGQSTSLKSNIDTFMVHRKYNLPLIKAIFYFCRSSLAKLLMNFMNPGLFQFIRIGRKSKYSYDVN
ncbi:putative beta-glycosyltransferase/ family 2 [Synechococcus sp. A18-40]|nr:putative beta-glycosyltransferase/ family 2 [Synechococcus sp. A18-40]